MRLHPFPLCLTLFSRPASTCLCRRCLGTQQRPDLSLCFLPAPWSLSAPCPVCHSLSQSRLFLSQRVDRRCQHLSSWIMHMFRSYDWSGDASALGRHVRTHQVTQNGCLSAHISEREGDRETPSP
ncbi:hypothetical protein GOODEAATRI_007977 [Goodea atripinnis]|uniref:Secreted protein n=1 Tax=Goodea atripinnis TaxID=208336 RepID=A0ABV0N8V9_9TELE